jgi:hypothetical protein
MTDTDIHSCGYYCDRPLCIKAQRDELREKMFSEQAVKTYEQEPQETIAKWIKANTEHRQWYICPKCSYQAPRFKDEWVGLTYEEVEQLAVDAGIITWVKRVYDDVDKKFYDLPFGEGMEGDGISLKQFADLISTRLKEKNI